MEAFLLVTDDRVCRWRDASVVIIEDLIVLDSVAAPLSCKLSLPSLLDFLNDVDDSDSGDDYGENHCIRLVDHVRARYWVWLGSRL